MTKLATALPRSITPTPPKTEEARELPKLKTALVVALAAPVLAPALPKVEEVREPTKAKVAEAMEAPAIEPLEPELSPERSLLWEEEFVAGVEQELRMMALQRKMVELRKTLTWPLCHWKSR